jgi:ornithine decarboxylase
MALVTSVIGCRRNNKDYVDNIPTQGEQHSSDAATVDNAEYIYYVNDGIYGSLSNIIFEEATYTVNCFHKNGEAPASCVGELHECAIFGPTCDSSDRLSVSVLLPLLNVGDYIYIHDVGAYSNSISTSFNGFKTSKYFYIYRD